MKLNPLALATSALALTLTFGSAALAKVIEETREVPDFTKIAAAGSSDVTIKVGSKKSVVVKAEDDEIADIKTEVKNGELKIYRKSKRTQIFTKTAHVYVTVPSLESLKSQGSGDAFVEGIKSKEFRLIQQGSGDVAFSGSCTEARITGQGSGDLTSDSFTCDTVETTLQGSGDFEISHLKVKTFSVDAMGSGDMDMSGSCDTLTISHMASGDVDAHDFKCKSVSVKARGSGDMRVYATNDVKIKISGSGDVEIYGGARPSDIDISGSGRVRTR